ncbi:hypothetical protein [Octadecabacter sp. R77987]|uniref:hypothetical protein n=1 Tax=Octadecabacter sp. R77987 TaxID=3093874 RepID=UPI0036726000
MKKISGLIVALTILSACGADAPPFTPTANAGVSVGTGGVSTTAGVGATNGTFSVGVSL